MQHSVWLPLLAFGAACTLAPPSWDPGLPGVGGSSSDDLRTPFAALVLGAVRTELDSWSTAVRGQSARPLDDHYSAVASIVQADGPFLKGATATGEFADALRSRVDDGFLSLLDVDVSDGIAYIHGAYQFRSADGRDAASSGRHVTIYRRENGAWKIRTQLFHSDAPARPFPGLPASPDPDAIELGLTEGGEIPRAAFLAAVTTLASITRAWTANDATGIAASFGRNALLHLPGEAAPVRGAAIEGGLRAALDRYGELSTLELDFTASGRLAVMVGRHSLAAPGEEGHGGHYILILAREGQTWRIRSFVLA